MPQKSNLKRLPERKMAIDEVNQVPEVGRLLFSVLIEEEKAELLRILNKSSGGCELGDAGATCRPLGL